MAAERGRGQAMRADHRCVTHEKKGAAVAAPVGPVALAAYWPSDRIQLTSRRASVSLIADALGGIDRPLTLPFQWLL